MNNYIIKEKTNHTVNNTGNIIGYTLYISTKKGKRRKWAGERETMHDLEILIIQNYLNKGFDYISANIVVKYTTGQSLIERQYILQ